MRAREAAFMTSQSDKASAFAALHHGDTPLLLPNPWDVGSARVLATLGFQSLATTSSGHAATLGRLDGGIDRDEALAHARQIVDAVDLPVSADYENGFADAPEGVAESVALATETGLAGLSIEDFTGRPDDPSYPFDLAVERVTAAVEAAHAGSARLVVTARCEHFLHGNPDLDEVITRLQAYAAVGADVVYAPGANDVDAIRRIVEAVDAPVNVLALPNTPPVAELATIGVARVSVGGGFSHAAFGALVRAGRELLDDGTYEFWTGATYGISAERRAFRD